MRNFYQQLLNITVLVLGWEHYRLIEQEVVRAFGAAHIAVEGAGRFRMRQADFSFSLKPAPGNTYTYTYNDVPYSDLASAFVALKHDLEAFVQRVRPTRPARWSRKDKGGHTSTWVGSRL